jgi:hypothetical protein
MSEREWRQRHHRETFVETSDRILPVTRWVSAAIIPFLVAASAILYLLPDRTDPLFAWTINPSLSAMFLGSAYIGGIWFFSLVLRQKLWHRVRHGFPAVVAFATLASVATFLHWDKFHFGELPFIVWVTLYVTTPFLVLAVLLLNRSADDGLPEDRDVHVPLVSRLVLAIIGVVAMVTGVVLFIDPTLLIDNWAWDLTPLTARILGAIFTLPGMVNVWLLVDSRWSSFRWIFQAQLVSLVFLIGALALGRDDLDWTKPATPAVVGGLVASLLAYLAFYLYNEWRMPRSGRSSGS